MSGGVMQKISQTQLPDIVRLNMGVRMSLSAHTFILAQVQLIVNFSHPLPDSNPCGDTDI